MVNLASLSRPLVAPSEQRADFVELFFDLVFVFAITKITYLTAHAVDLEHILRSLLILWLIWWAWSQFTWTLNAADTRQPEVRMATLIATVVTFVMASAIDQAFDVGVMWFAIPYIVLKALGMGLFLRVTPQGSHRVAVARMALLSLP